MKEPRFFGADYHEVHANVYMRNLKKCQIATNLSIEGADEEGVHFTFTASYMQENKQAANMLMKGTAYFDDETLKRARQASEQKKMLSLEVLTAISNNSLGEGMFVSRVLNIAPPVPLPKPSI